MRGTEFKLWLIDHAVHGRRDLFCLERKGFQPNEHARLWKGIVRILDNAQDERA